jgi:hypothetical protein
VCKRKSTKEIAVSNGADEKYSYLKIIYEGMRKINGRYKRF